MAALMGVFRDVCHAPVSMTPFSRQSVSSAMIKYALPRDQVLARVTKRGAHIRDHVVKTRTQRTFCEAFKYYLENGIRAEVPKASVKPAATPHRHGAAQTSGLKYSGIVLCRTLNGAPVPVWV